MNPGSIPGNAFPKRGKKGVKFMETPNILQFVEELMVQIFRKFKKALIMKLMKRALYSIVE